MAKRVLDKLFEHSQVDVSATVCISLIVSIVFLFLSMSAFQFVEYLPMELDYQVLNGSVGVLFLLRQAKILVLNELHEIVLFGSHLDYFLTVDKASFSEFYPNLGSVFIIVRDLVGWFILLSFVVIPSVIWVNRRSKWLNGLVYGFGLVVRSNVLYVSVVLWICALLNYFLLRQASSQPVIYQLLEVKLFLISWVIYLATKLLFSRKQVFRYFESFFNKPASPHNLAVIRIIFFGYLIVTQFNNAFYFAPSLGSLQKQSLPGIGWLIELIPVTPQLYQTIAFLGCGFSFLAMIGFRTRIAMFLTSISVFYVFATPNFFGKLWHAQIFIWITWILAVSPCYDVLSVDARMKSDKSINNNYGFHLKIIWLHFGLIYGFAGFYKLWLCGFDWALSDSMINQVRLEWFEHFDRIPNLRIDMVPWLLKIGGFGVILFELAYFFLVFKTKTRYLAATLGIVMHNAIGYFMYISFFWALQVFYIVFVPWDKLLKWIGQKKVSFEKIKLQPINLKSWKTVIPLFILCSNFICGVFNVNSYPFTIYPVYAELIDENVKYLDFRPTISEKPNFDLRQAAKASNYRWESFTRIEYALVKNYEVEQVLDTASIKTAWKRWVIGVPETKQAEEVKVYIVNRHLEPEKAQPISEELVYQFVPN